MTSQFGSEEVSFIQTGYRVYDFAVKFSRRIEIVADEIKAKTRDPELRRQTLLWKMNTSATINLTINHIEPMAASIDLWAMASQMTDFYTTGKGKTSFGEFQAMVVQTCQEMELQAREITRSIIAPKYFQILEPELEKWVEENPFEDHSFARQSAIETVADIFSDQPSGLFALSGNLELALAVFQARLDVYLDNLPRQLRWQSELLALGLANDLVDPRIDTLYQTIEKERGIVMDGITSERKAAIANVETLTGKTVKTIEEIIQLERQIILQSVQQNITDQRIAVMEEINTLQKNTLQEIETIITRSIDYTLIRIIAGCILAYIVLLLTVIFLLRGFRK